MTSEFRMYSYIILFTLIGFIIAAKIPSFITPCSIKDSSCLAKSATKTLKSVLNGNKALGVPSLNPIELPLVQLKGTSLNLELIKLKVYGLDNCEVTKVEFDQARKTGLVNIKINNAQLISDYVLSGKISVLALDGRGKSNITASSSVFTWHFNYDFEDKKGDKHLRITKDETTFKVKGCIFQFEDLFKNDPVLTKSTNDILTQEWKSVVDDLGSGISATVGSVFKLCAKGIFSRIPFNKLTNL